MKLQQLNEASKKSSVYIALEKIGLTDVTEPFALKSGIERKFDANHKPKAIHDVLIKNGWEMVTHTRRGAKMEPYIVYRQDAFKGGSITLHHRGSKVYYVSFDYRTSND